MNRSQPPSLRFLHGCGEKPSDPRHYDLAVRLLASGRDADVFALDDERVLRRCRDSATRCDREAELMRWARRHGYPVPEVLSVNGPDLVLEWVHGPTMVDSLLDGGTTMDEAARILADLHARLHALPIPAGEGGGGQPRADGDLALVHLDLHPYNVILSPAGPVLIDWSNSRVARAGYDVALTALILAQAAVDEGPLAEPAGELYRAFGRLAGRLAEEDIQAALADRARNPTMSAREVALLPRCADLLRAESD